MGAWGAGAFDNDDAADWSGALDGAGDTPAGVGVAVATLAGAATSEYLEMPDACVAVAAAAWLAAGLPGATPVDPAYGPSLAPPVHVSLTVRVQAVQVLRRVLGDQSEWRELWEESGDTGPAVEIVERLIGVLSPPG